MKAAVVQEFGLPLVLEDRQVELPGPEQVVVEIEASGLCHTDIHAARGEWPIKPQPPFVPGHEGVGVVVRAGEGNIHGIELGDRVAMPWLAFACGDCRYCNSGRETLCPDQRNMGYSMDGCFSELALGNARHLVKVPDGVCPSEAAPLTCAGVTTYKAVKESGAGPASLVAVFGVGGLGHLAVQYARICGASVVAVDVNGERLQEAGTLGADHLIDASERDPIEAIMDLGGADQAIVTAADPKPFEQATRALARGGTLVCVGLPAENHMDVPIFETVLGGLTVRGSIVGTKRDLEEVFELQRRGLTRVLYAERPLEEVNEAINDLLTGHACRPRTVLIPSH